MTQSWQKQSNGVLHLPSGRVLRGRALHDDRQHDQQATFTVFLLGKTPPIPDWDNRWLRWPDFWLPSDRAQAKDIFLEAWRRSATERVEFVCRGGRGRTGTALACLAIIDGIPPNQATAYVRAHYDRHAVETPWQRRYVSKFSI